jgi:hypothetical protein
MGVNCQIYHSFQNRDIDALVVNRHQTNEWSVNTEEGSTEDHTTRKTFVGIKMRQDKNNICELLFEDVDAIISKQYKLMKMKGLAVVSRRIPVNQINFGFESKIVQD